MNILLWVVNIIFYIVVGKKLHPINRFLLTCLTVFVIIFFTDSLVRKPSDIVANIPELPFIVSFFHNLVINTIIYFVIYVDRNKKILASNEELKVNALNLQNALLKQKIQPHFLFNSLNVLKSLIHQNPYEAEQFLINVSNHLRNNIDYDDNDLIAISKELEFGLAYLQIMKIRFKDALQYTIHYEEAINENEMIPVFSLQVLFENAIKHNHFTNQNPLVIEVIINTTEIIVKNNFEPINKTGVNKQGFGLNNLMERYLLLVKKPVEILQRDNKFEVKLPIISIA
jgi:LytS/YehU family sensor histidine kinase